MIRHTSNAARRWSAKLVAFVGLLLLLLLLVALAGCGGGADEQEEEAEQQEEQADVEEEVGGAEQQQGALAGNFVGTVAGTEAQVGILTDQEENRSFSYLCDGGALSEWFLGSISEEGTIDLQSDGGARLLAWAAQEGGVEGTVTLPNGEEHSFAAQPTAENWILSLCSS
jgi:hypothetical protein